MTTVSSGNSRNNQEAEKIMDIEDFNFDFDEHDEARADMLREARLLEDEKPLDFDGEEDCEGCKI